jgi:hypothetical protein
MHVEALLGGGGRLGVSVDYLIAELEDIVGKMRTVKADDYVLASDTNLFMQYCEVAVQLLQALYQAYKDRTGKSIPKVEEMIGLATSRVAYVKTVAYGEKVYDSDHNVVVDVLKPIDIALIELEKALGLRS